MFDSESSGPGGESSDSERVRGTLPLLTEDLCGDASQFVFVLFCLFVFLDR